MSLKGKCHQIEIFTKTQMSQKIKLNKKQLSPKCTCHQNPNVTKTQISPLVQTFVFLYLPNRTGTTSPPGLVHINPNGLPGHDLSDSRLVSTAHT